MRYFYIHGFNSGPESRSGSALERLLGGPVIRVRNDYSHCYEDCIIELGRFVQTEAGNEKICLMGTSLGGFYALQLRLPNIVKVTAWNPVIFPALQLASFVGENLRFTDGQKWIFSNEARLSYAAAPDPRVWQNFGWLAQPGPKNTVCPERRIFLGDQDELLDHDLSAVYWRGHAPLEIISSGHSILNFEHAANWLRKDVACMGETRAGDN